MGGKLPYIAAQSPYPFPVVIDRNDAMWGHQFLGITVTSPDHLASLDPATTLVVVTADPCFAAEIAAEVACHGPFPVVMPLELDDLALADQALDGGSATQAAWPEGWIVSRAGRDAPDPTEDFDRVLALHALMPRPVPTGPGHACLWIGSLSTGGAERQMVYLALGLRQLGWRITLVTQLPPGPAAEPYVALVDAGGVTRLELPTPRAMWERWDEARLNRLRSVFELGWGFSHDSLHGMVTTTHVLQALQPDLLVGFLDIGNLVVGAAGVLTGVPAVLMCGRSVNPTNFPGLTYFFRDQHRIPDLYRTLLSWPSVRLANNSRAGAASYAAWLGIAGESVGVVPNAVNPDVLALAGTVPSRDWRSALGIPIAAPVVVGVLRLTEEKGPLLFLEVAALIRRRQPDLHVILVGDGPLRSEVEERRAALGLQERAHLLGRRSDVFDIMLSADLLLQTSRMEGMPNVVLEVQALGLPVVATDVGGTSECLAPCLLPFIGPAGDARVLADRCLALLAEPERGRARGREAAAIVARRASPAMMAARMLATAGIPAFDPLLS